MLSFGRTADYDEMLTRIALGTLIVSCLATWWLRATVPEVDNSLAAIDKLPAVGVLKDYDKLPVGTLLCGVLTAFCFRIVKMHDRISDVFRVRRHFDLSSILIPICGHLDKKLTLDRCDRLARERNDWMYRLFYTYASSSKDKAKIDEGLIRQALDWWTLAWVILEASLVLCVTAVIAYLCASYKTASEMLAVMNGLVLLFSVVVAWRCRRSARAEVQAILSDRARVAELREKLNAL